MIFHISTHRCGGRPGTVASLDAEDGHRISEKKQFQKQDSANEEL